MTKTELREQALALPVEDRLALVDALLEEGLPPLTAEQKAWIDEGWASYESDPGAAASEEDVDAEIAARQAR